MPRVNEKCTGCKICVNMCPEGFEMDGEKAVVIDPEATCLKDAADACPVDAIELDDESEEEPEPKPGIDRPNIRRSGRGKGQSRRSGQDAGRGPGFGEGPGGYCICPNCNHREPHQIGTPCFEVKCPECNTTMIREK